MSVGIKALVAQGRFDRQLQLVREHWRSCRRLWIHTPEPLKAARLGADLAADFWWGAGLPGIDNILPIRDGRFEFNEGGRRALIVPAYDGIPGFLDATADRHLVSCVTWSPSMSMIPIGTGAGVARP